MSDRVELLRAYGYRGAWSPEPHVSPRPHESGALAPDAATALVAGGQAVAGLVRWPDPVR